MEIEIEKIDFYKEFVFTASRSSGAGGQNVNKVNTKVELKFHINNSQELSDEEKQLLSEKLKNRINNEGFLQIVSQETRSQLRNKELCIEKFFELISEALKIPKQWKKKKPSRSWHKKRVESKRRNSEKKERRRKID